MKTPHKLLLAFLALLAAAMLSLCFGQVWISPNEVVQIICGHDTPYRIIFLFARLPRTMACLSAGAALACSGAVLQRVLANNLASPGIVGVNAGAGLGVSICCAAGVLSGWAISVSAFLGSLAAVCAIGLLAYTSGASKSTVILCGVALNSMLSAMSETITVLRPDVAMINLDFRVGGFSAVSYERLIPAHCLIVLALIVVMTLCNELDVLSLGDETACDLGLPVRRYRLLFLLLAALLAGAAVSFAGLLGFVGLIVPHLAAKLVGRESRFLLPMAALCGAALVTLCDLAARLLFLPYELPVGILMAVLGGPVFLVLLLRHRGGHHYA